MAWMERDLGSWKVAVSMSASICAGVSAASASGVRAAAKRRCAAGSDTSSSVRIVRMHAMTISKGEP